MKSGAYFCVPDGKPDRPVGPTHVMRSGEEDEIREFAHSAVLQGTERVLICKVVAVVRRSAEIVTE